MEDLVLAFEEANFNKVQDLINVGINLNQTVEYRGIIRPPVNIAALLCRPEIIDLLVKSGADINLPDEIGCTALHSALEVGSDCYETLVSLLKNGADINMENKSGHTPFYTAVHSLSLPAVQLILKYSPDLNSKPNQEAFAIALKKSFIQDAAGLVESDCKESEGMSHSTDSNASVHGPSPVPTIVEITKLLYDFGFSVPVEQLDDGQLFINAVRLDLLNTCKDFLSHGAIVGSLPVWTGLELAIKEKKFPLIEMMLRYSSDALSEGKGLFPEEILQYAASSAEPSVVEFIINLRANVNYTDFWGETPLMAAVQSNDLTVVEVLLKARANVNKLNFDGKSPCYYVFDRDKQKNDVLLLLIKSGADMFWRDPNNGQTLLHVACCNPSTSFSDVETVKILLDAGIDVDARDYGGETALHKACRIVSVGCPYLVRSLIYHGANINLASDRNDTPINVANSNCLDSIKTYLSKMIVAGLVHNCSIRLKNTMSPKYRKLLQKELRQMEKTSIAHSKVTYREFLNFDRDRLAKLLRNENISQELEARQFETAFPLYRLLLSIKLLVGKRRLNFFRRCEQVISAISEPIALPSVCLDTIINYLTEEDLSKFNNRS